MSGIVAKLLARARAISSSFRQPASEAQIVDEVRAAYRCVLGRDAAADPEGLAHWVAFRRRGGSYEKLLQNFVLSEEFARRAKQVGTSASAIVAPPQSTVARIPKMMVIGNCQHILMAHALRLLTGGEMPGHRWVTNEILADPQGEAGNLEPVFRDYDKVFIQPALWQLVAERYARFKSKVVLFPSISFLAYHPDLVYVYRKDSDAALPGVTGDYHSSIVLLAWKAGLGVGETVSLFKRATFQRLGFLHYWDISVAALIEEGKAAGMELEELIGAWSRHGCFMHSINHPKISAIADVARALLKRLGISTVPCDFSDESLDILARSIVWPVYPEIAQKLGISGDYRFKLEVPNLTAARPARTLDLKEFIEESFRTYSRYDKDDLVCKRFDWKPYKELFEELQAQELAPIADARREVMPDHLLIRNDASGAERFAVLGNCQTGHVARCLQALVGGKLPRYEWVTAERLADWVDGRASLVPLFAKHEKVFVQPWIWNAVASRYPQLEPKVVLYPSIGFMAYHPDLVPIISKTTNTALEDGPLLRCHSSLVFMGWTAGLSANETVKLFNKEVFQRLGFFNYWQSSAAALLQEGEAAGFPLDDLLAQWSRQGCFMYCHVHPKLFVIADIVKTLLRRLDIEMVPGNPIEYAHDYLANGVVWPVYPEIADELGSPGSYLFKQATEYYSPDGPVHLLGLQAFVEKSFATYEKHADKDLLCLRFEMDGYRQLLDELLSGKPELGDVTTTPISLSNPEAGIERSFHAQAETSHPYRGLPAHCFWRKAVSDIQPGRLDPVIKTRFSVGPSTRIATAGSCFAQRISERLVERGFNYLRTENPPRHLTPVESTAPNYGSFSARFGFIYTARQLLQLFQRAYGDFVPVDSAWINETGQFVDPFRPSIEPEGFDSIQMLEASRAQHLAAVRRMFETLDVFVFTLGLSEAWRNKLDGAVFPVAPGVAGGVMNFDRYQFINFTAAEVDADLDAFILRLAAVNPHARLILTVSPVPLAATYADRHVLVSTAYSKSVLRVAAEQIVSRHDNCDYFPSYEIITGSFNRGAYFAEDLRSITPAGVDHVMRLFFEHYAPSLREPVLDPQLLAEARKNISYLCDEDLVAASAE